MVSLKHANGFRLYTIAIWTWEAIVNATTRYSVNENLCVDVETDAEADGAAGPVCT